MNPADSPDAPAPSKIDQLGAAVDRAKSASLLHKGEAAAAAMDIAVAILAELDRRVGELEERFNAIEHPARHRQRDDQGRFLPLPDGD